MISCTRVESGAQTKACSPKSYFCAGMFCSGEGEGAVKFSGVREVRASTVHVPLRLVCSKRMLEDQNLLGALELLRAPPVHRLHFFSNESGV